MAQRSSGHFPRDLQTQRKLGAGHLKRPGQGQAGSQGVTTRNKFSQNVLEEKRRLMNYNKKENIFGVTLNRRDPNVAWGVRIVGGADLGTPIIVTRVQSGSPSEKRLIVGDIIKKIEDYDSRDISHQDANRLFLNAGNAIKLVIRRDPNVKNSKDLPVSSMPQNLEGTKNQKVVFPPPNPTMLRGNDNFPVGRTVVRDDEESEILNQPYRTTPLVLPGAKAKHEKELAPTESYLRHHPNPMMRAPPSHHSFLPQEVVMKQKVADSVLQRVTGDEAFAGKQVVHKQFNSPIGLYSDQNILDTIHHQTGITPNSPVRSSSISRPTARSLAPKKTIMYDPAKSETFKALQEEQFGDQVQEVRSPAQPKVFTPNIHGKKVQHQAPQSHTYDPLSRSTASPSLQHHLPYLNSMGHSEEHIAQSGSFKRLMNMVMGESEY